MQCSLRRITPLLLVACTGLLTGCSSNNKGKIEGKWKITGGTEVNAEEVKMMEALKITPYMEFKSDGTASFGLEPAEPMMQKDQAEKGERVVVSFKYTLGFGDSVELYDLPKELQDKNGSGPFGKKDRAKIKAKITGDTMTMTDDDKKEVRLTRMK